MRISTLRKKGAGGRAFEVTLVDGSFFCVTRELAEEAGLREGDEWDGERLHRLAERSEHRLAYERALSLLARREHSRKQLADKLSQREFSGSVVEAALNELEREGSLSDRRFAEEWVEARLRRTPNGVGWLRAALQQRGVSRDVAEPAIRRVAERNPELFDSAAERALSRLLRTDRDSLSLKQKLHRRGFSPAEIREALYAAGLGEKPSRPRDGRDGGGG